MSGGRPPRERRMRGARAVSVGALVQDEASWLMLVDWFNLNTRKVEDVIIK